MVLARGGSHSRGSGSAGSGSNSRSSGTGSSNSTNTPLPPVLPLPALPQVTSALDRLVEPLAGTLQAKVKADAGKRGGAARSAPKPGTVQRAMTGPRVGLEEALTDGLTDVGAAAAARSALLQSSRRLTATRTCCAPACALWTLWPSCPTPHRCGWAPAAGQRGGNSV